MDLRDYLLILRRRKWIGVIVLAVSLAASALLTTLATPVYQTRATLFVGPQQVPAVSVPGSGAYVLSTSLDIAQRLTKTYAQMIPTFTIADDAVRTSRLDVSAAYLLGHMAVAPVPDTQLIDIVMTDPDPVRAANMANATGAAFVDEARRLTAPAGETRPLVPVTLFQRASTPAAPISPNASRNLALAAILGIVAGVALIFAADYLDVGIRGADDVERLTGLPILAMVPMVSADDLGPAQVPAHSRAAR